MGESPDIVGQIIAITGPSGVGKSSFVLAGVLPRLRARFEETAAYPIFQVSANSGRVNSFAMRLLIFSCVVIQAILSWRSLRSALLKFKCRQI